MIPAGTEVRALRSMKVDDERVPYGAPGVVRENNGALFPYLVDFGDVKNVPCMADEIVEVR